MIGLTKKQVKAIDTFIRKLGYVRPGDIKEVKEKDSE